MTKEDGSSHRLLSVDAFRGLTIVLMFLVSSRSPVTQLRHVDWFGFHLADLVYPSFLFLIGISLVLSLEAQARRGVPWPLSRRKILFRCLKLFMLGIVLLSASYGRARFNLGTLQCIALALLLAFPLVRLSLSARLAAVSLIYLVLSCAEEFFGAPGSIEGMRWIEGHTYAEHVDRWILGKPKGPEGVLATVASVPAIVFGSIAAGYLQDERLWRLIRLGFLLIGFGSLLAASGIPVSPQLVTSSFSLIASGWAALVLTVFVLLTERMNFRKAAMPLVVCGANAIGAYVFVKLSQALVFNGIVLSTAPPMTVREAMVTAGSEHFGAVAGNAIFPITKVVIGLLFCALLYRRKIFLKV